MRPSPGNTTRRDAPYWRAVYIDGSTYSEPQGPYEFIDWSRLAAFEIVHRGRVVLGLKLTPGVILVWRKRHLLTQSRGIHHWLHVVGCVDKNGAGRFCYVDQGGKIVSKPTAGPEDLTLRPWEKLVS